VAAEIEQQILDINDQRGRAWDRAKEILDRGVERGDGNTAEELEQYDRIEATIARLDKSREKLTSDREYQERHETIEAEVLRVSTPSEREDRARRDEEMTKDIASFFRREHHTKGVGALEIDLTTPARIYDQARNGFPIEELRAVIATDTGASGGSLTVPTTVATSIYAYMTASVAMRRIGCTIITTDGGNAMNFPRVATHGVGTQIANQDTAFAGTNPVLGQMTLNAYDFGQLVAISSDMLEDSGVDVLSFVTRQIGRAIGQVTATGYVTGSGSSTIQGIQGAVAGAGTVVSGGSLFGLPAGQGLEKLIDLQYSVVDSYRQNGAAWLMRDLTGASIRKIRDGAGGTAGQFVWQPSPTVGAIGGQPDTFLGDPVYFDPNVASMASGAKIVYYGDWSAYYIRDTRNFRLERSDDLLFDKNQIAFRGILRTDGDLIDSNAINALVQVVA
jgi:HK97 family phage major capsid protein